jgi:hypothetical protein
VNGESLVKDSMPVRQGGRDGQRDTDRQGGYESVVDMRVAPEGREVSAGHDEMYRSKQEG